MSPTHFSNENTPENLPQDEAVEPVEPTAGLSEPQLGGDESPIVDDPDEPLHPDEQTVAETEAAQVSLHSNAPRRKYKAPRSLSIMVLVVAMIMTLGVYVIYWANGLLESREKNQLITLEARDFLSRWEQLYLKARGFRAAGEEHAPLSVEERGQLETLKQKYGSLYKPDAQQLQFVEEVRRYLPPPTTEPAK